MRFFSAAANNRLIVHHAHEPLASVAKKVNNESVVLDVDLAAVSTPDSFFSHASILSTLSLPAVSDVMALLSRSVSSSSANANAKQKKQLSIEFANVARPIATVSTGQAGVLRECIVKGVADAPFRRALSVP